MDNSVQMRNSRQTFHRQHTVTPSTQPAHHGIGSRVVGGDFNEPKVCSDEASTSILPGAGLLLPAAALVVPRMLCRNSREERDTPHCNNTAPQQQQQQQQVEPFQSTTHWRHTAAFRHERQTPAHTPWYCPG